MTEKLERPHSRAVLHRRSAPGPDLRAERPPVDTRADQPRPQGAHAPGKSHEGGSMTTIYRRYVDDLIAEAREALKDRFFAPTHQAQVTRRLADALEGQMQDREMLVMFLRNTEQDRDAALAVIEKAKQAVGAGVRADPDRVYRILSSVPADVLRERDAARWDEGAKAASPHGGAYLRSILIGNPYRQAESRSNLN